MNRIKEGQCLGYLNHYQLHGNSSDQLIATMCLDICKLFHQRKLSVTGSVLRAMRPASRSEPEVPVMMGKQKIL